MSDTLGDAMPREQARCRELLRQYHDMGLLKNVIVGFAVASIEASLREADESVVSGDPARVIAAYKRLKKHE